MTPIRLGTFDVLGFMNDENTLRQKAREAIQAGRLPNRRPERTWGGRGCGIRCAICSEAVKSDDIEFELEFARTDDDAELENHHFHLRCFAAWEFERRNGEATQGADPCSSVSNGSVSNGALPDATLGVTISGCEPHSPERQ